MAENVLPAMRLDVDIDVGDLLAAIVHEALEQQVVADRVDVRDPEHVDDERAGRAPPARTADPHDIAGVIDDVGDEQEESRPAHLEDHVELVLQAVVDLFRDTREPTPSAFVTTPGEQARRGLAL